MAKAIDSSKQILAGLLIFSFLLVILVATRFMNQDDVKESEKPKEGFKAAPTRAADCKCLPGYVPSKGGKLGGQVYTDSIRTFWYFFVPTGTTKAYRINEQNSCGIPHIYTDSEKANQNIGKYPTLPRIGFENAGVLTCDILNNKVNDVGSYICQSLADASDIKACY